MDKNYEAIKEILEEQIKKIVKKGDITPQELDNLYKASAVCLDFETKEAMKKAEKSEKEKGEYSQRGNSYDGNSNRGYTNDNYSNHYPWFMPGFRSFDGSSNDYSNEGSYRGNSYDNQPNWNMGNRGTQPNQSNNSNASYNRGSYGSSYDGQSYGGYSERESYDDGSYRRGRDARTGRYVSRDSYDYSRHNERERMLDRLESMLDNASSEKDRRAIEQCIERIGR